MRKVYKIEGRRGASSYGPPRKGDRRVGHKAARLHLKVLLRGGVR